MCWEVPVPCPLLMPIEDRPETMCMRDKLTCRSLQSYVWSTVYACSHQSFVPSCGVDGFIHLPEEQRVAIEGHDCPSVADWLHFAPLLRMDEDVSSDRRTSRRQIPTDLEVHGSWNGLQHQIVTDARQ